MRSEDTEDTSSRVTRNRSLLVGTIRSMDSFTIPELIATFGSENGGDIHIGERLSIGDYVRALHGCGVLGREGERYFTIKRNDGRTEGNYDNGFRQV